MGEIEIIECSTIGEAELEYNNRIEQGCWQMVKALKPVWSWKKMKTVFRFSMKKVEKAYHLEDFMKDTNKIIKVGCETAIALSNAMAGRKAQRKLKQLLNTDI